MMYYDHAMLGATLALASGVRRRHGWPIVVMAAVAAMLPDWDGLSEPFDWQTHRRIHRVWGHNLPVALLVSGLFAAVCYLLYVSARARYTRRAPPGTFSGHALGVWIAVGLLAVLSHVGADVLYSRGGSGGDWPVALFWPFSSRKWAVPLEDCNDRGATLLLALGLLACGGWRAAARPLAWCTLFAVTAYLVLHTATAGA